LSDRRRRPWQIDKDGKEVFFAHLKERMRKIMKVLKPRKALWDRRQSQRLQLFFFLCGATVKIRLRPSHCLGF
jgi:hypothetical protein